MTATSVTPVLSGSRLVLAALAIAAMAATTAHADTIVYTSHLNVLTAPSPNPKGGNFQLGVNGGNVTGIANTPWNGVDPGYNFVYSNGATPADVANNSHILGASTAASGVSIILDNAVVADPFDSQDGGAFLALDSVYQKSAININIPTIAGQTYVVAFDWAGTQQKGYIGATTDTLTVGFGAASQATGTINVVEQGFTGWLQTSKTFVAANTGTTILSFLASGTPAGADQQPAMTLLDNITVSQKTTTPTPEPTSLMLLSTGLIGVGSFVRSRYSKKNDASNL